MVVPRQRVCAARRHRPWQRKRFGPAEAQPGFPTLDLAASSVFDRQSTVDLLFDRDSLRLLGGPVRAPPHGAEGVYLLASVSAANDRGEPGRPADNQKNGLTLFVIRLNA